MKSKFGFANKLADYCPNFKYLSSDDIYREKLVICSRNLIGPERKGLSEKFILIKIAESQFICISSGYEYVVNFTDDVDIDSLDWKEFGYFPLEFNNLLGV